jgi:hypothetical protein
MAPLYSLWPPLTAECGGQAQDTREGRLLSAPMPSCVCRASSRRWLPDGMRFVFFRVLCPLTEGAAVGCRYQFDSSLELEKGV